MAANLINIDTYNYYDEAISLYMDKMISNSSINVSSRRLEVLKYNTAVIYYEIINSYLNTTIESDNNFMTIEECQILVDKLNEIIGTNLVLN